MRNKVVFPHRLGPATKTAGKCPTARKPSASKALDCRKVLTNPRKIGFYALAMKAPKSSSRRILSFLAVSCTVCATTIHAGSVGGPPPFTNGSPLTSGVDGSYQASARGTNLSGVIKFQILGGGQSFGVGTTPQDVQRGGNSWAIFYQGKLYTGLTEAVISDANVSGVLSSTATLPLAINNLQGNLGLVIANPALPQETTIRGQNLSGFFNAKLSQNSPNGKFSGKGEVETSVPPFYVNSMQTPSLPGLPNPLDNMAQNPSSPQAQGVTDSSSQGVPDPSNPSATGYGKLNKTTFKIRGTRNSTTASTPF
jgi:hypothetical protein